MARPKEASKTLSLTIVDGETPLVTPVEFARLVGCIPQKIYTRMTSTKWAHAVVEVNGLRVARKLDLRAALALWYATH